MSLFHLLIKLNAVNLEFDESKGFLNSSLTLVADDLIDPVEALDGGSVVLTLTDVDVRTGANCSSCCGS